MRIVVFGASSRAGLYIVKEALEKEHRVAAFTRRPLDYPLGHPKLDIIGGDILDPSAVVRAVRGAHSVIFALGGRISRSGTVLTQGINNVILAMEAAGCRRLVCLSFSGDFPCGSGLPGRLVWRILRRRGLDAKREQLIRLRACGLEWVLVEAPRIREGPGSGRVSVSEDSLAGKSVFLGDLAAFLIEELERGRHKKEHLTISSA